MWEGIRIKHVILCKSPIFITCIYVYTNLETRICTCYNDGEGGTMKTSELIKILKRNDCFFVEHGKEHDKWHSNRTGKDIRIPRHGSKEIPSGTANRILKDAGIR